MSLLLLYCFITYMVMLGMIIETYHKDSAPTEAWWMFVFSPFICPILIGMGVAEDKTKNNKQDGSEKH